MRILLITKNKFWAQSFVRSIGCEHNVWVDVKTNTPKNIYADCIITDQNLQPLGVPVFILQSTANKNIKTGEAVCMFSVNTPVQKMVSIIQIYLNARANTNHLPRRLPLTPIEEIFLTDILNGASDKEISRRRDMPLSTVKYHVRKLLKKLEVKNRTQAALIAKEIIV